MTLDARTALSWQRRLHVVAIALGLAILVLAMRVVQRALVPPAPPAATTERPRDTTATPVTSLVETSAGAVPRSTAPTEPSPSAPTTATLYGSVRRADGTPLPRGTLTLRRQGAGAGHVGLAAGSFAFPNVTPDDYELAVAADGELPRTFAVHVDAPRTRVDLQLDPTWQLTVNVVTPDGSPFAEGQMHGAFRFLVAIATRAPLAGDLPPSNTPFTDFGLGNFRDAQWQRRAGSTLPQHAIGQITLPPGEPAHVTLLLRNTVLAQAAVAADQPEVTFTLAPDALTGRMGSVRWRCIDADGQPLPGARSLGRVADENGRITVTELLPGPFDLTAQAGRLRTPPLGIDVAAGDEFDLGDVVLRAPVTVRVQDEVAAASVEWWRIDRLPNDAWRACVGQTTRIAASREASVDVYPGRYAFLARGPNAVAFLEVDLTTAPTAPLRLVPTPSAELRLANGVGTGYARVRLLAANTAPVYDREWSGTWTQDLSLPLGRYEVEITDATNRTTRRPLLLGRDGAELRVP